MSGRLVYEIEDGVFLDVVRLTPGKDRLVIRVDTSDVIDAIKAELTEDVKDSVDFVVAPFASLSVEPAESPDRNAPIPKANGNPQLPARSESPKPEPPTRPSRPRLPSVASAVIFVLCLLSPLSAFAQFPVYSVFADEIPAIKADEAVVQAHEYLLCVNKKYRQPVWAATTVSLTDFETENVITRNFVTPSAFKDFTLESSDYKRNGWADQGHLIGLKFKAASRHAFELNWMMQIAIQASPLNQGPWLKLETHVRELAVKDKVHLFAFCLFESDDETRKLPNADEAHRAPSHFGMIVKVDGKESAWIMPQNAGRLDGIDKYEVEVEHAKERISATWWKSAADDD